MASAAFLRRLSTTSSISQPSTSAMLCGCMRTVSSASVVRERLKVWMAFSMMIERSETLRGG